MNNPDSIVDDNLKNLGIPNMDALKAYIEAIKDLDQELVKQELIKLGITDEQLEQFYKLFQK